MLLQVSFCSIPAHSILAMASMAFLAVVFLQSGLDKVTGWQGNLSWLKEHFGKTFLKSMVTPLLAVLTLLELASGLGAVIAIVDWLVFDSATIATYTLCLSLFTFLCLFTGQRIAKDYAGAGNILIYAAFTLITAYFWL